MADTFSQIYIQIVFGVQNRKALIDSSWEEKSHKYITGIITNKGQKLIAINGMPDHLHIFIGMKPNCCLSDLVREIKKSSNTYINENKFSNSKFNWQEGFGAFSYSHSHIDHVCKYILNQKIRHNQITFKEEYFEILEKFNVDFKEEYIFDFLED